MYYHAFELKYILYEKKEHKYLFRIGSIILFLTFLTVKNVNITLNKVL